MTRKMSFIVVVVMVSSLFLVSAYYNHVQLKEDAAISKAHTQVERYSQEVTQYNSRIKKDWNDFSCTTYEEMHEIYLSNYLKLINTTRFTGMYNNASYLNSRDYVNLHRQYIDDLNKTSKRLYIEFTKEKHHTDLEENFNFRLEINDYFAVQPLVLIADLPKAEKFKIDVELEHISRERLLPWEVDVNADEELIQLMDKSEVFDNSMVRLRQLQKKINAAKGGADTINDTELAETTILLKRTKSLLSEINKYQDAIKAKTSFFVNRCSTTTETESKISM